MILQLSEIFNNFVELCQTEPLLAACIIAIGIVGISAAAIGVRDV